jgi:hypothetical protein
MPSSPSIAAATLSALVAGCTSDGVRWETAHAIVIQEVRWTTPQDISVIFVNPYDFDLCIQSYQWPDGTPADDVLTIRDQRGHVAPFVGDEPVVMGGRVHRVRAGSSSVVNIDLRQAYDTRQLEPPLTLEYSVLFHEC